MSYKIPIINEPVNFCQEHEEEIQQLLEGWNQETEYQQLSELRSQINEFIPKDILGKSTESVRLPLLDFWHAMYRRHKHLIALQELCVENTAGQEVIGREPGESDSLCLGPTQNAFCSHGPIRLTDAIHQIPECGVLLGEYDHLGEEILKGLYCTLALEILDEICKVYRQDPVYLPNVTNIPGMDLCDLANHYIEVAYKAIGNFITWVWDDKIDEMTALPLIPYAEDNWRTARDNYNAVYNWWVENDGPHPPKYPESIVYIPPVPMPDDEDWYERFLEAISNGLVETALASTCNKLGIDSLFRQICGDFTCSQIVAIGWDLMQIAFGGAQMLISVQNPTWLLGFFSNLASGIDCFMALDTQISSLVSIIENSGDPDAILDATLALGNLFLSCLSFLPIAENANSIVVNVADIALVVIAACS